MSASRLSGATDYDVVIVGGGLVGATFARALACADLRVAVAEAAPPASDRQTSLDDRPIALSPSSRRILEGLGLWSSLEGEITPIRSIHVSDRGHFGVTRIRAVEERVDALGYVTDARALGRVLSQALSSLPGLDLLRPACVTEVTMKTGGPMIELHVDGAASMLRAKLLVAADGGRSVVREMLGIGATESDYGQTAVSTTVTPRIDHRNTAYERFTHSGPLALLPLRGRRCGLIWTVPFDAAGRLLTMEDADFIHSLQRHFGMRLGGFVEVGPRRHYPLTLIRTKEQVRSRLAIIGNAAHTLHPVAGQGFNLALRDVGVLAEILVDAARIGRDVGELELLERYAAWRRRDQRNVTVFTDGLVRVFSNRFRPLALSRNMGLLVLDLFPSLKRELARRAMGLAGRQPRLVRGLPL